MHTELQKHVKIGICALGIYSDADKRSLNLNFMDETANIGEAVSKRSYLNIANILKIARDYGVDAVHPDYGFLSENFNFISALESAEIIFIGLLVKGIKN